MQSIHEQSMVIREALLYIAMLKLEIEALQREYEDLKITKKESLHQFQVSPFIYFFIIGEALLCILHSHIEKLLSIL
jgi:hypothetical protein